jgi:molybdopterin-guanine dinucleotide biosynthesis protein A
MASVPPAAAIIGGDGARPLLSELMEPTGISPLAGLVLAGGAATRMGGDKALIVFEGQALIVRVAERLARATDPVLVASGRPGRLGAIGFPEVADLSPGCGPLGGLVAGLSASPHQLTAVVAVDMPHVSPGLLGFLASLHADEDAVAPLGETGVEPLHAVYSRSALPAMQEALRQGQYGLRRLLSRLRVRHVAAEEWGHLEVDPRFAFNMNRPQDLRTGV